MNEKRFTDITFISAFKIATAFSITILALGLVFYVKDILILFFTAIIFAIALDKPIEELKKLKIPRLLSVLFIYAGLLVIFSLALYAILPPLAQEVRNFAINYPAYVERFQQYSETSLFLPGLHFEVPKNVSGIAEIFSAGTNTVFGTITNIFGGFLSFFVIVFVAAILNLQSNGVRKFVLLTPSDKREYALKIFDKIQQRVGGWLWGKTVSSILVGFFIFWGLFFLDIPFALSLALLATMLNFIAFVGPFVASVPAVLIGFTISPIHALAAASLYFLVNSVLEGFVFMPILMKKAADLNPILLIFFVLLGGKLGGILGIIIAVPVAAIFALVMEEVFAGNSFFQEAKPPLKIKL